MPCRDQPVGQAKPIAEVAVGQLRQNSRRNRIDRLATCPEVSSLMDECLAGDGRFPHHRCSSGPRHFRPQGHKLAVNLSQLQGLEFRRVDQVTVREEVQQQPVGFVTRPQVPVPLDDLPALQLPFTKLSAPDQPQHLPSPVPAEVAAGSCRGLEQPSLPAGLQPDQFVGDRLQQLIPLEVVLGQGLLKRNGLPGQGGIDVDLVGGIQERVQPVELPLRHPVVLVVMAPGTSDRQSQPGCCNHLGPVDNLLDPKLLGVGPSLAIAEGLAEKPGPEPIFERRGGQQVAGQLPQGQHIKRRVGVELFDQPLAVTPGHRSQLIGQVAVAVSVVRKIHPLASEVLAVMRTRQ